MILSQELKIEAANKRPTVLHTCFAAYPTYPNNNWEPGLFPGKVAATVLSLKIEFTEGPKNP